MSDVSSSPVTTDIRPSHLAQEEAILSRKFGSGSLVIGLHVILAYGLIMGTAHNLVALAPPPLKAEIIVEKKPPPPDEPPPKLPTSKVQPPPPMLMPLPEVKIEEQPKPDNVIYATPIAAKPAPAAVAKYQQDGEGDADTATEAWLDTKGCDLPSYPWQLSDHEEGTVLLLLLVDVDGHVVDSRVAKSSGVPLLDETARVGMAKCKYKPGTTNGTPQRSWKKLRFIWQLPF